MSTRFPLEVVYQSGFMLYAVIRGVISGTRQVWNPTLSGGAGGWEAFNSGHWSQYVVALTEEAVGPGTGYYAASYPSGISGVLTSETFYVQGGDSPALGDAPAASLTRSQGQNVAAVDGDASVQSNLQAALATEQRGTATGTPTNLVVPSDVSNALVDAFIGRVLIFTGGACYQAQSKVIAYDGAGGFTLAAPLPAVPAAGDKFIVV